MTLTVLILVIGYLVFVFTWMSNQTRQVYYFDELWSHPLPEPFISVKAVGKQDEAILSLENFTTMAFSPSGELLWRGERGGARFAADLNCDGVLFTLKDIGWGEGEERGVYFHEISATDVDGSLLWTTGVQKTGASSTRLRAWKDGVYFFHGDMIYSLDLQGAVIWEYELSSPYWPVSSCIEVTGDGSVIWGSVNHVQSIDVDGKDQWVYVYGSLNNSTTAIASTADGTVYISYRETGELHALDSSGKLKWQTSVRHLVNHQRPVSHIEQLTAPAVGTDGTVYIGDCWATVHALKPSGAVKWHHQLSMGKGRRQQMSFINAPIHFITIGPDGNLYLSADSRGLVVLDPTGQVLSKDPQAIGADSPVAFGTNGLVYVVARDELFALRALETGL